MPQPGGGLLGDTLGGLTTGLGQAVGGLGVGLGQAVGGIGQGLGQTLGGVGGAVGGLLGSQPAQPAQPTQAPPRAPAVPAAQPGPMPGGNADLIAQLQQLAQLRQAGVLSDAEFQAAKAKLLGG